jgi:hypothetical protein
VRGPKDAALLKFKFQLMGGDIIEADGDKAGVRELWVVRAFSQEGPGRLGLVRINDARPKDEMDEKEYWRPMVNELFKRNCVPVEVDLLGNIHYPKWWRLRARAAAAR